MKSIKDFSKEAETYFFAGNLQDAFLAATISLQQADAEKHKTIKTNCEAIRLLCRIKLAYITIPDAKIELDRLIDLECASVTLKLQLMDINQQWNSFHPLSSEFVNYHYQRAQNIIRSLDPKALHPAFYYHDKEYTGRSVLHNLLNLSAGLQAKINLLKSLESSISMYNQIKSNFFLHHRKNNTLCALHKLIGDLYIHYLEQPINFSQYDLVIEKNYYEQAYTHYQQALNYSSLKQTDLLTLHFSLLNSLHKLFTLEIDSTIQYDLVKKIENYINSQAIALCITKVKMEQQTVFLGKLKELQDLCQKMLPILSILANNQSIICQSKDEVDENIETIEKESAYILANLATDTNNQHADENKTKRFKR
jgi:hypothetical protein